MIVKIIVHEVKQRFFHWTTILFFVLLIFQGFWFTKGNFDYFVNEGLLMNASSVFYKNLAGLGLFMFVIVAIVTGTSLYKDIQHKTGQWVYTLPVSEKRFYLGRFLSAYFYNVIIALGYVIGMLLVPYSGIGPAHRFGPAPIGQLLHGFVYLVMPNLFFLTSIFFFAMVYTRKIAAGYLAIISVFIAFAIMQLTAAASGITTTLSLLDPLGYVATDGMILTFPIAERNTGYIPLSSDLFTNRLIWLGVSLVLFVLAFLKFSFKGFLVDAKKKNKAGIMQKDFLFSTHLTKKTESPTLSFNRLDFLKKLWSLAVLEFSNVVRPVSFKLVLGLFVFSVILHHLFWNASYYLGPTVPLTSTMTYFRLPFGILISITIMVWAGELFFKDRVFKIHHITDTLPVPVWVTQLSRFFAIVAVAFLMALSFMILGILIQVLKGGASLIELDLYVYDLLGYNWGWLNYVLWIGLVFFVSGLTGNRFLTHILSVGFYMGALLSFEMGLAEQIRFFYAAVPGVEDYSEISGYGIWVTSAKWFFLMWAALAIALVLFGIYFWKRGSSRKWGEKLRFQGKQLSWPGKIVAVLALVCFFGLQSFIERNVNQKGNFALSEVEEQEAAEYETKYGHLKARPQPKINHLDLEFDFYPDERSASYRAKMLLVNKSVSPIDSLFLNFEDHIRLEEVFFDGKEAQAAFEDGTHHVKVYPLSKKMMPKDTLRLVLTAEKKYLGFTQSGGQPQPDLMYNGSFGSIWEFLPKIGYDGNRELLENRKREEQGLGKLSSRKSAVDDPLGLKENLFAADADLVSGTLSIGTVKGQVPIGPGKLIKEWEQEGRAYRTYRISTPNTFNWYLASAEYKDHKGSIGNTKTYILPSPKHLFTIPIYQKALHGSIDFIDRNLSEYPFTEVRVIEIPYYQEKFYAFPNTIAISEKEGWYADTTDIAERAYLFHSLSAQVMRHWVYDNIAMANVQGVKMLSDALPEALALQVLKKEMGMEAFQHILKKKHDFYAKERNNEANTEAPLLYADGADYLELNKGANALYRLMETIGTQRFNRLLVEWADEDKSSSKRFIDLYQRLLVEVPMSKKGNFTQLFETTQLLP